MNVSGYDYLLYFGLPSCSQCRGLKENLKKANVVYEESKEYDKYGVTEVPVLVLIGYHKNNVMKEVKRHVGYMTVEEINEFLKLSSVERRNEDVYQREKKKWEVQNIKPRRGQFRTEEEM